jgi:hypothetical protein
VIFVFLPRLHECGVDNCVIVLMIVIILIMIQQANLQEILNDIFQRARERTEYGLSDSERV